jgi:hypothetical protein
MNRIFVGPTIGATLAGLLLNASSTAAKPWDDVRHFKCAEVISADGSFTAKTEPVLRWLVGFRDGLASLAVLDKRLLHLQNVDPDTLADFVFTLCKLNPAWSVEQAVRAEFWIMINSENKPTANGNPGPQFKWGPELEPLAVPRR